MLAALAPRLGVGVVSARRSLAPPRWSRSDRMNVACRLQPTVPPGRASRSGATHESPRPSRRSLTRRSATKFQGGTGYQPVPPGYQPDGREGAWTRDRSRQNLRTILPVPRGESPRGTGGSPVLPGGCDARAWFRPFRAGSNRDVIPGLRPGLTNCAPLGLGHESRPAMPNRVVDARVKNSTFPTC